MKAKLLLVEDNDVQGAHIKTSLEERGYEVGWAKTGIEALKRARTEQPDLVILDVVLGDVDGSPCAAGSRSMKPRATFRSSC